MQYPKDLLELIKQFYLFLNSKCSISDLITNESIYWVYLKTSIILETAEVYSNYVLSSLIYVIYPSLGASATYSLVIAFKFMTLIAILIFVRGGIPRYRFDHLTKIGWIKFLSLILSSILIQFLLLWLFL